MIMTTSEIANRLVDLCRKQEWEQIYCELYSQDAESIEPEGTPWPKVKGLDEFAKKGEQWQAMIEEQHGMEVSDPLVAGDFLTVKIVSDNTMKGMGRVKFEELCLYEVKMTKLLKSNFSTHHHRSRSLIIYEKRC